ncbi:MAG: type II toxin-antitoxin system Phd/YefM family antitoxin [Propionibacteriaceae bacterium]|jgi:prevent-host-death family protein|nr:type II toxin-antitoxin system Phd/YefM family antitoxin [Propionibacteriaceae bacterium]
MIVTATQFKQNLGRYLDLAASEDVYITRHGREAVRVTGPASERVALLDYIAGIARSNTSLDEARAERLARQ